VRRRSCPTAANLPILERLIFPMILLPMLFQRRSRTGSQTPVGEITLISHVHHLA
jgi:hypothetical protein